MADEKKQEEKTVAPKAAEVAAKLLQRSQGWALSFASQWVEKCSPAVQSELAALDSKPNAGTAIALLISAEADRRVKGGK